MSVCLLVCVYTRCEQVPKEGKKVVLDPQELELQGTMGFPKEVLGNEPGSSARTGCNYGSTSPTSIMAFLNKCDFFILLQRISTTLWSLSF